MWEWARRQVIDEEKDTDIKSDEEGGDGDGEVRKSFLEGPNKIGNMYYARIKSFLYHTVRSES